MLEHVKLPDSLEDLLTLQGNVATHEQMVERGKTRHQIATLARNRRWQKLYRGVYYTLRGEVPRAAWLWGAVLRVGHGGVLSHETAAEVWGIADKQADVIHVSVPRSAGRLPASEGVRLHYSARLPRAEFRAAIGMDWPPVTHAEEVVLDLATTSPTAEDAVAWAIKACQRKTTTPELIGMYMLEPGHRQLRWRADLTHALTQIQAGVQSPLERRYLLDVERAHHLPEGR